MKIEKIKSLSFVIPVKDENETIEELVNRIFSEVEKMQNNFHVEVILIDDGSKDNSWEVMSRIAAESRKDVRAFKLRRNFGKSVALELGFLHAKGDIVFTMDADLQDDPSEIPRFLEALEKGYDLVSGWKRKRHDPLSKTLPSRLFNKVTSLLTGVKLHDFNCGFKCYKKGIVKSIKIYGELHRYIPILAHDLGYKIGEITVEHHPRKHGYSKYGWERYLRGFIDLVTVLATTRWLNKPGHLFGGVGVAFGLLGVGILSYLSIYWLLGFGSIGNRPLLLFGVMFCVFSLQMISLGIIAEFFIRAKNPRDIDKLIADVSEFSEHKK